MMTTNRCALLARTIASPGPGLLFLKALLPVVAGTLMLGGCTEGPPGYSPALAALESAEPVEARPLDATEELTATAAEATNHAASIPAAIQVLLSPHDLMTAIRGMPSLTVARQYLSANAIEELSHRVSLVTWPEAEPLEIQVTHVPAQSGRNIYDNRFIVEPVVALAEGWYALRLDMRGLDGFRSVPSPEDKGTSTSRFRVGSQPVVRGFYVSPGDTEIGVTVELSERVRDMRSLSALLRISRDGIPIPCRPGMGNALASENGGNQITIMCPIFPLDSELHVSIAEGMRASNGEELTVPFGESSTELVINPTRDGALRAVGQTFRTVARRPGSPGQAQ